MDQFRLVQPVDRLCLRVVVAVALAADRGLDAGFSRPLSVADADVLRPAIRVTDERAVPFRLPSVQGLLQGIQHETSASLQPVITASAAFSLVRPVAICPLSRRSTSRQSDGAPGERIAARPATCFCHPAARPMQTSSN